MKFNFEDDDPHNEATPIQFTFIELTADELTNEIMEIESDRDTVRNKRQLTTTQFENFDQKTNQLYNLLSTVMKAISEMSFNVVRNIK